jgi:hypothetical protein
MPLCTGAEDEGEAYFGVVSVFSPPAAGACGAVLVGVELPLLLAFVLDDPHPAASNSAAQAIRDGPLVIARPTLA